MARPKRQVLIVLGMHRSGTSGLGGLLAHLGAQAPKTLMVPTKDNPRGYWESSELMKFHDRILRSAGSRWNDWGPFNPDWLESPAADEFREQLPSLIEKEFGDARLFVVKDPRLCLFLPLWLQVLDGLDISPKVVFQLRHPLEVTRSLEVRDHFGRNRSLLLWLRHVLDAEASSRKIPRTFVLYEQLLTDWSGLARKASRDLGIKWPKWSGDTEAEITEFLSSELRHHDAGNMPMPDGSPLLDWVSSTYTALRQLVDGNGAEESAFMMLDAVRREFDHSSAIYAGVVREHQIHTDRLCANMKTQLANKTREMEALATQQGVSESARVATEQLLAEHEQRIAALTGQLEVRKNAQDQHASDQAQQLDALLLQLKAHESEQAKLVASHQDALALLRQQFDAGQAEQQQRQSRHAQKMEALVQQLEIRKAEQAKLIADHHDALAILQQRQDARQDEVVQLSERHIRQLEVMSQKLEAREVEQARLAADHGDALAMLRQQLDVRQAEIDERIERHAHELAIQASSHQTELGDLSQRLQALDAKHTHLLSQQEEALAVGKQRATELVTVREALSRSQDSMRAQREEAAKLASRIVQLEQLVEQKNQAIATSEEVHRALVQTHLQQLEQRDRAASENDRDQRKATIEYDRRIALLEHELVGVRASSQSLQQQLENHRNIAAGYRAELDAVTQSRSWKLTAPLRSKQFGTRPQPPESISDDGTGRQALLLRGSDLFNPQWYLERYPEVGQSGMDPALHYLRHGAMAGFNPGPGFNTADYLSRYPDVRISSMNPLVHYLEYGQDEGRSPA